jgi:non-specific serine/threonine protein kinase
MIASCQGDYRTARTMFDEALTICRDTDDRHSAANVLINLGTLASDQGDYDSARAFLEESLAIFRALGGYGTSNALGMLGRVTHGQGDYPGAQALLEKSLAIAREEGHQPYISAALTELGSVARSRGDHDAALALLKEALAIQREAGERLGMSECLEAFAAVVLALAGPRFAARIWGGAEKLRDEIKAPMTPVHRAWYDREVAAARAALGDDAAFDLAWHEGRAMRMDQAVKYALEFDPGDDDRTMQ